MARPIWPGHVLAAILSFVAAFFGVLNVLFSDIFGLAGHLQAVGLVGVVYVVFGWVLERTWPAGRRAWVIWLIIPGLLVGIPFTLGEGTFGWFPMAVLLAMVLGTLVGTGQWSFGINKTARINRAGETVRR